MADRSQGIVGLGGTLAALGGGALLVMMSASQKFPWWQWGLAWTGLILGLLLLMTQAVPGLEDFAARPARRMKQSQLKRARYRQRLRCMAEGHEFEEVVRLTSRGWMEYEGAERRCPTCGSVDGFQSLGVEPLNRAARKGRFP